MAGQRIQSLCKKLWGDVSLIDHTLGESALLPMYEQLLIDLKSLVDNDEADFLMRMMYDIPVSRRIKEIEFHLKLIRCDEAKP